MKKHLKIHYRNTCVVTQLVMKMESIDHEITLRTFPLTSLRTSELIGSSSWCGIKPVEC